ncbi:hypothetical protein GNP80_19895 [Aliivibrio fischeri]|uniref:hypothetical protein n=1 Tax=Aliivibrio fischeri TaxID=668 RepID=UPI0012DAD799|nr:hypothetical protein [Aliivibrio fischeri]MUK94680.1 hypothetical protein [Aliivibrio fischeri]
MNKAAYKQFYSSLRFARSLVLFELNVGRKHYKETSLLLKEIRSRLHSSCAFTESFDFYDSTDFGGWVLRRTMKINKLDGVEATIITDKFNSLPKSYESKDYFKKPYQMDKNFSWYAGQLRHKF